MTNLNTAKSMGQCPVIWIISKLIKIKLCSLCDPLIVGWNIKFLFNQIVWQSCSKSCNCKTNFLLNCLNVNDLMFIYQNKINMINISMIKHRPFHSITLMKSFKNYSMMDLIFYISSLKIKLIPNTTNEEKQLRNSDVGFNKL